MTEEHVRWILCEGDLQNYRPHVSMKNMQPVQQNLAPTSRGAFLTGATRIWRVKEEPKRLVERDLRHEQGKHPTQLTPIQFITSILAQRRQAEAEHATEAANSPQPKWTRRNRANP